MTAPKPPPGDPFQHACRTDHYPAAHDSGKRALRDVTLGVVHCTESSYSGAHSAAGVAAYFQNPASGGSTQVVVDDGECYRCVADDVTPWGAPPMNTCGWHVEIIGRVEWSAAEWAKHLPSIERAAYKMSLRCKPPFGIVPVWLSAADLVAGKRHGVTSHANISAAFHATDHTDPGPHFPYDKFMAYLTKYTTAKPQPEPSGTQVRHQ